MEASRRGFLKGVLAVSASALLPATAILAHVPRIVGDGVHDDTDGINALLAGRPFEADDARMAVGHDAFAHLAGGRFRITSSLQMERGNVMVRNCIFLCDFNGAAIEATNVQSVTVQSCQFHFRSPAVAS